MLKMPFGNAGAFGEHGERERRERRFGRRLDHDRAAGGERRAAFARDHGVGEIPRRDRGDDADRLLQDDDAAAVLGVRDDVAVDAFAFFGEPFDERGAVGDLAARLRRAACLARWS